MKTNTVAKLLGFFISWRLLLFAFLGFSVYLPLQRDLLGGGMGNYVKSPYFWAWANFDGEHYVSIAQRGYGHGEEAFFPLYPLLIRIFSWPFGLSLLSTTAVGLVLSNLLFIIAVYGLYKLVRVDYSEEIARATILLLLLFPTSFYFGSVYTESLFLALTVWSFYFARTKKWSYAVVLATLSTATRFVGIFLLPAFIAEMVGWEKLKDVLRRPLKSHVLRLATLLSIPFGLAAYMYYLKASTGDSLAFFHSLSSFFGEQRSQTPIILPQVFYRYFFKILPSLTYSYLPVVFATFLELTTAILFTVLSVSAFVKTRLSYALYLAGGFLIPTFSGSFSSLPRYAVVLFPGFLLMSIYFLKLKYSIKLILLSILFILLGIATALFVRGYWVA